MREQLQGYARPAAIERVERFAVGGAARALVEDFAIPLEAKCFERAQHLVGATRHDSRGIEILDAHQPACADAARIEVAADGSQQ